MTTAPHVSLQGNARTYDAADWERAAAAVLRKSRKLTADDLDSRVQDLLAHQTLDDIRITPLGLPSTTVGLPDTGLPGHPPFTRGSLAATVPGGWQIRTLVDQPDPRRASQDLLSDLENGATSVLVALGGSGLAVADLGRVLEGVYLDLAPIVLDCPDDPVGAANAFGEIIEQAGVGPAPGTNLGADPLRALVRAAADNQQPDPSEPSIDQRRLAEDIRTLAKLAVSHGVLGFVVDATIVNDLGGSDVQELGYATAAGAAYLRLLTDPDGAGLDIDTAVSLLEFRFAATVEQFPTIAKLRAARQLWYEVCVRSGASPDASGQRQHAVTARPILTVRDPWVNMLRATVAAFAAGVGGAQAVTALPFDTALGVPDETGRRIARNTSSLLLSESHVGRVADPAGGSYAVEKLTADLAQSGWAELQRIERSGGVVAAVADGSFLGRIQAVAARRDADIAHRRRPITGVSEFPDLHEELPVRSPRPGGTPPVARYSAAFEAMRDQPATGPVFLATMGSVAAHSPRATFARNLLAAGGVDTVDAGATAGVAEVLESYAGQRVVCLVGPDSLYAAWGVDLITGLRSAGAACVLIAGTPGENTVPAAAVDSSCSRGSDALAFLALVRQELAQ